MPDRSPQPGAAQEQTTECESLMCCLRRMLATTLVGTKSCSVMMMLLSECCTLKVGQGDHSLATPQHRPLGGPPRNRNSHTAPHLLAAGSNHRCCEPARCCSGSCIHTDTQTRLSTCAPCPVLCQAAAAVEGLGPLGGTAAGSIRSHMIHITCPAALRTRRHPAVEQRPHLLPLPGQHGSALAAGLQARSSSFTQH